jgi:deoxyribodipyrimidine photolyase-related protein
MNTGLVFPHQLFENSSLINRCTKVYLIEEYLFFNQYQFHKQKIAFHRASMKFYEAHLKSKNIEVVYIESQDAMSDIRKLIPHLKASGINAIEFIDPIDSWLFKRIQKACKTQKLAYQMHNSELFILSEVEIKDYFADKKRMFQTDFYKHQRLKRQLLLDKEQKPLGGKWTYDDENRLKYPKGKAAPLYDFSVNNEYYEEAVLYTEKHFAINPGTLNAHFKFPNTFESSQLHLQAFLKQRFRDFGAYEDAIVSSEVLLHHSLLSPLINVGLLQPKKVIDEAIAFASDCDIPLNSLEGFVRQVLGWREYIRAVYVLKGSEERTRNYWGFKRKIPASFWQGNTGIVPLDNSIKKVLRTGYCHHIERLMVLGNFMLLCEFDPNEVYQWFMELFIDSYDWVMVPNVYGMSQFADGGLMATKPYISGSNYLMKMSDHPKGKWQEVWDALFWRFMHVHREFFLQNPRLGMLVRTFDKMPESKRLAHLKTAEAFLEKMN